MIYNVFCQTLLLLSHNYLSFALGAPGVHGLPGPPGLFLPVIIHVEHYSDSPAIISDLEAESISALT